MSGALGRLSMESGKQSGNQRGPGQSGANSVPPTSMASVDDVEMTDSNQRVSKREEGGLIGVRKKSGDRKNHKRRADDVSDEELKQILGEGRSPSKRYTVYFGEI